MAGGRRKKIKQSKEKDKENVSERKTSNQLNDSSRKRFGNVKKIDSSIITTKRLTVGVKGIFGNARYSNSVYRDIQERLESRKVSKEVTSEIEHNLSRIIPNRKKYDSHDNDMRTPGTTSRHSSHTISSSSTRSKETTNDKSLTDSVRSISSRGSNDHLYTPNIVRDELTRVANDIISSIPPLKIFKGYNMLDSIRKELQQTFEEKHTLQVIPKYEKEEYTDEAPALKKHCGEELSEESPSMTQRSDQNIPQILDEKASQQQDSVEKMEEDVPSHQFNPHHIDTQGLPTTCMNPMGLHFFTGTENGHFNEKNRETAASFTNRETQPFAAHMHHDIFSQPISSLRCNRRRSDNSITRPLYESHSDLLDYIDNIPFQVLENRLLGRGSHSRMVAGDRATNAFSKVRVTIDLEKPTLDSPSPPKMYRMNMF